MSTHVLSWLTVSLDWAEFDQCPHVTFSSGDGGGLGLVYTDIQENISRELGSKLLFLLIILLICLLSLPVDSTLTLANLLTALEEVPDEQWESLNGWLGVPISAQDTIYGQCSDYAQYRRESLQHWLYHKPLPSWKCVARALFIIGEFRVLKEVERKYLKSEGVYVSLLLLHW